MPCAGNSGGSPFRHAASREKAAVTAHLYPGYRSPCISRNYRCHGHRKAASRSRCPCGNAPEICRGTTSHLTSARCNRRGSRGKSCPWRLSVRAAQHRFPGAGYLFRPTQKRVFRDAVAVSCQVLSRAAGGNREAMCVSLRERQNPSAIPGHPGGNAGGRAISGCGL